MKTLTIQLGEKIYTSGKITAWFTKECMSLNRELMEFSKTAQSGETDIDGAAGILEKMQEFMNRKVNLICEAYGNKFTADEVLKNLTTEEIEEQITQIAYSVQGVVAKN